MIEFKEEHNFTNSKFDVIQAQMIDWEQSETSTPENDPEALSDFDPIEQVLFNADGEVMIAGRIYSFGREDYDYEIIDEYETSLVKIYNGEDVSDDPNILSTSKQNSICYSSRSIQDYMFFSNNNRKVQRRVGILSYNSGKTTRTSTKIISYLKENNGSWSRSRSYISMRNDSKYNMMYNCSRTSISKSHQGTLKKREERVVRFWTTTTNTHGVEKNYGLKGTYRYGSASSGSGANIITHKFLE